MVIDPMGDEIPVRGGDEIRDDIPTVERDRETIVLVPKVVSEPAPMPSNRLSGQLCPQCAEELEREAHFCSQCGTTVDRPETPSQPLASQPLAAPSSPLVEPEPVAEEKPVKPVRNTLHLVSAPPDTIATDPAELMPPPSSRPSRLTSLSTADITTIALVCACAALLAAAGSHLFSPRAIPGFSPAEVDVKVQMRSVQWLLAGILAALVGLLARR